MNGKKSNTFLILPLFKKSHISNILYHWEKSAKVQETNTIIYTIVWELFDENYLEYLGNKINLNIGIRYSENEDKTLIYMATPIIKLDY